MGFEAGREFGLYYSHVIGRWMQDGRLKPHPYTVMEGGLMGVEKALKNLREGKAHATKYFVRIGDTASL